MKKLYIILSSLFILAFVPLGAQAATANTCTTNELDLVCPVGQVLQGISNDGTKICVTPSGDGSVTTGTGLSRCLNIMAGFNGNGLSLGPLTRAFTVTYDSAYPDNLESSPFFKSPSNNRAWRDSELDILDGETGSVIASYYGRGVSVFARNGWVMTGCNSIGSNSTYQGENRCWAGVPDESNVVMSFSMCE